MSTAELAEQFPTEWITDPIAFKELCWPELQFYDKQVEIIESVINNYETIVPAGNGLGKDFIAAFIALWFFCSRRPARVVTTSVQASQLDDVLWGEIRRFIDDSQVPLPIQYNHMKIRQLKADGTFVPLAELVGQVVTKGEALLGRHLPKDIPRTLAIFDEASGIDNDTYESADTWTHRKLIIGNCYPCQNFFREGVRTGDVLAPQGNYHRRVIRIKAEASPNIQLAHAEQQAGVPISRETLIPGLVDYDTYTARRSLWNEMRQCIGLDAEFYEGAEVLMYPPDWLNRAETLAESLPLQRNYINYMGVDSAEGGDNTCWTCVDKKGLKYQLAIKTGDTSDIPSRTIALMREWNVRAENVFFDRGGGGKQHADQLRKAGHKVQTVAFGSAVQPETKFRRFRTMKQREEAIEEQYVYKNTRAQMFGELRKLMDPSYNPDGFAIPAKFSLQPPDGRLSLRGQLSRIPYKLDREGRIYLPPKNKKNPNSNEETLIELIGHSPDEADSLVLAVRGLYAKEKRRGVRVL